MTTLHVQHPWLLWAAPLAVALLCGMAWRSRAEIGRRGRVASLVVRSIIVILFSVASAGPRLDHVRTDSPQARVIILSDASQSVEEVSGETLRLARSVRAGLGPGARVTELSFAGQAWRAGEPAAERDATDIESALDAANAQTLEAPAAQVVVISDGRSTRGDAVGAAGRLGMRGASVHTIPVGARQHEQRPPSLVRAEPPVGAHVGLPAAVRITVAADRPTRVTLRLLAPDGKTADQVELPVEGRTAAVLHFTPRTAGIEEYSVVLDAAAPASVAAASAAGVRAVPVFVEGPPRILIADNFTDEMQGLKHALSPLKIPVDIVSPDNWPADLRSYAAIVVSDWSGRELTDPQRAALRRYVEEQGGGMVFIGGGNVMPARWAQNPLAAALPVVLQEKPKELTRKKADVAVVFVVDRSGSMQQGLASSGGGPTISKLDLVKAAIIASVQTLPARSQVGVIAFDTQSTVLVPPTPVSKKDDIARLVDSTSPGGGTTIEPAIRDGMAMLASMPGDKYLVVLTDGIGERPSSDTAYWGAVADDARRAHMSWTSIAVGADADQSLLSFLAQEAHGKFFYCDTSDSVPQVFLQQAKSIKRLAEQKERPFRPAPGPAVDRLRGFDPKEMPELTGRVRAKAREHADVVLLGERDEPLLSSWQFGLGRVVAFTSDAKTGWGRDWVTWKGFSSFWVQVLQGVMRVNPAVHARVAVRVEGQEATFNYVVSDEAGHPVDGLAGTDGIERAATASSGAAAPIPAATTRPDISGSGAGPSAARWSQLGPGEYQARIDLPPDGREYLVSTKLAGKEDRSLSYAAVVSAEQNREMSEVGVDAVALRNIAGAGGGICSADPADIAAACRAAQKPQSVEEQKPLWPAVMIVALLLWPIDVAVRKFL